MYYELYLDIYFLENVLLNVLVLWFTAIMADRKRHTFRMIGAAVSGSILECLSMITPLHRMIILYGLTKMVTLVMLTLMSFPKEKGAERFQKIGICMLARMTLEGSISLIAEYTRLPFWSCLFIGFYIVCLLEIYRQKTRKRQETFYEVTVIIDGRKKHILALWDSGNQLCHPISGKPVHIIDFSVIEELLEKTEQEELKKLLHLQSIEKASGKFSLIPFRTIGKEYGLMPALVVDTIQIRCGENIKETKDCLVAVSETTVSAAGRYQMILHP